MMKWKVMKLSRCNSIDHEDVRKSLEILDSVLAEFDDGAKGAISGQFETNHEENHQEQMVVDATLNDIILRKDGNLEFSCNSSSETFLKKRTEDGATSRFQVPDFIEDGKFSPPPVPKRNPATRLSSKENLAAGGSVENIYSNDFEIRRNIFDSENRYQASDATESSKIKLKIKANPTSTASSTDLSYLGPNALSSKNTTENISSISAEDNDDVFVSKAKLTLFRSASASVMSASTPQRSPSVASRRAFYEKSNSSATENIKRHVIHSDSGDASFPVRNSPFLRRKFNVPSSPTFHKRNVSDSADCKSVRSNSSSISSENRSQNEVEDVFDSAAVSAKKSPISSSQMTKERERIVRLNERFAHVRYLLKTNQIKPLAYDPPAFVPTPPPRKIPRKHEDVSQGDGDCDSPMLRNVQSSSDILQVHDTCGLVKDPVDVTKSPSSFPNNISSISYLLPTDTLNRPHLGLSYSMEDDLSPGVKEILTSTPKSDRSMVGLSTFSHSASSLGYGSGQSDCDLNLSLKEENKIPIASLKSQTLPIGIKLGPPFSYVTDINYDVDIADSGDMKTEKVLCQHEDENGHYRSSSAPPIKQLQQRKNKFGMSKKSPKEDKERQHKKDDNISVKSNLSLDEVTFYRKIPAVEGSTDSQDLSARKQNSSFPEEKTKRRSVWKSILRRK